MANKTIIEHLETIETSVSNKSISEQIGEDFRKYLYNSTLYFYETDIRKFKNTKKRKINKILILLCIEILFLITSIIFSIINTYFSLLIVSYLCVILITLLSLIYYYFGNKQKQIANSKFNPINIEFYEHDNHLEEEKSYGKVYIIFSILKVIILVFSLILGIIAVVNSKTSYDFLGFMSLIIIQSASYTLCSDIRYYYSKYVFETDNSYIITNLVKWEKIEK